MKRFIFLIMGFFILTAIIGTVYFKNKSARFSLERLNNELLKNTNITLSDAINIAIRETNGKVVEAKLKYEDGNKNIIYKTVLLKENQFLSARIDAKTGQLLSIIEEPYPKRLLYFLLSPTPKMENGS